MEPLPQLQGPMETDPQTDDDNRPELGPMLGSLNGKTCPSFGPKHVTRAKII